MAILSVRNLSFSFGVNLVLDDICFAVESADRCGIVGVNGAGKSTLFSILNGELERDAGEIIFARGTTIGYFRQNNDYIDGDTIGEAVRNVFSGLLKIESELAALEEQLGKCHVESERHIKGESGRLLRKYDRLRTEFELGGGYEYRSRIRGVLNGLDVGTDIDDSTPVSILSGGQKTRLALALMLINPPDLLLLDEPTNHLDIRSLEWLESYLKNYRKSFLAVSHDRYFLDAVTTRTLELEHKRLTSYAGGYTAYVNRKEEDRAILEKQYENQQREITRLKTIIARYRAWNTEASHIKAKSRQKALDRMEKIDRPSDAPKKINLRFNNTVSNSQDALYIDALTKGYSGRRLFAPFTATVRRNDRIMILGPNGCGKSTLLRMLSERVEPDGGMVRAGSRIEMGYYDQEHYDLDDEKSVLDEVYDDFSQKQISQIRGILGAFLFVGDDVYKKIAVLSGGEKARVALVKIILSQANMLLLDEPTNHLDINTRERLEEALQGFEGVILAVSHDRYFIRKLATRIFYFEGGQINDFAGGYDGLLEYLAARGAGVPGASAASSKGASADTSKGASAASSKGASADAPSEESSASSKSTSAVGSGASADSLQIAKQNWLAMREERSKQRKSETRLAKLEDKIDAAEKRLAEIDSLMKSRDVASDHVKLIELTTEQDGLNAELDNLLAEWEALSDSVNVQRT